MNRDSIAIAIIDNGSQQCYADFAFSWIRSLIDPGVVASLAGRMVSFIRISYAYPSGGMNHATRIFMESGADRLIITDLDQDWNPIDLERLLSHDVPVVAGMYTKKRPVIEFTLAPIGEENPFSDDPEEIARNPLVEVKHCSRGFINIHRSVFEKMTPLVPVLHDTQTGGKIVDYWQPMPNGHSEDFAFCDRVRAIGIKVLVDQRCRIGHWGPQRFPIPVAELREAVTMHP